MTGPLWLSEADVSATLGLPEVYDALLASLARQAGGQATGIAKATAPLAGGGSIQSLGAVDADMTGFKNWINTPRGAQAYYLLFDSEQGQLLGAFQAGVLGALRTAATAAIATDHYAPPDAHTAALLGTGRQALAQLAAIHLVRPLRTARVWSRDPERRSAFADRASRALGVEVAPADSVQDAVSGTQIVTAITRTTQVVLERAALEPGTHVNAMGAILPHAREVDPAVLAAAVEVAVDDLDNARQQSCELIDALAMDASLAGRLVPLHQLAGRARPTGGGLTVLKSVGAGISDLSAARALLAAARSDGREHEHLALAMPTTMPRLIRA